MLLAFRNGRLLTEAGIESERTLLVRDGRIEAIVGAREVVGADRVDRSGRPAAGAGIHRRAGQRRRRRVVQRRADRRHHRGDRACAPALWHHGLPAHVDQRRSRRGRAGHRRRAPGDQQRRSRRARHPHRGSLPQREAARRARRQQAARARRRSGQTTGAAARRRHHGHARARAHHTRSSSAS